jgi:hypothetical protein
MPVQTLVHIAGHSDVVSIGIALAAEDVDKTPSNAPHAPTSGISRARKNLGQFFATALGDTVEYAEWEYGTR